MNAIVLLTLSQRSTFSGLHKNKRYLKRVWNCLVLQLHNQGYNKINEK